MVFLAIAVNRCQKSWTEQNGIKRKTIIQKGSLKKQHVCLINCGLLIYSLTAIVRVNLSLLQISIWEIQDTEQSNCSSVTS